MNSAGKPRDGNRNLKGSGGRGQVNLGNGEGGGGYGPDEIVGWRNFGDLLKAGNEKARLEGVPIRVVFLLDKSGSMNGMKLELAKSALKDAIADLSEYESFYLILFDSHLHHHRTTYVLATKINKDEVFRYLDQQHAGTGTNISQVFENVFNQQTASVIWFISDGQPTEGERDTTALVNLIKSANRRGRPIHTIGLGAGKNFNGVTLMSRIARGNKGVFRGIDITGYK